MNAYGRLVLVISLLAVHVSTGVAQQTIHIRLAEAYAAQIDIGIGKAERSNGADTLRGTLTRQPDGTWTGEVDAKVSFDQAMGGILAQGCPSQPFEGTQRLKMSGKPVSGFNSKVQSIPQSVRPVEFLLLSVRPAPAAAPKMTKGDINCLSMYTYEDGSQLLPLNDSRWLPEAGYTIGLPRSAVLEYEDNTVDTIGSGGADLPVKTFARWKVHVERP